MSKNIRKKVEDYFEKLGRILFRHRIKSLLILCVFAGCLVSQLPKLVFDPSQEAFLHKDDPKLVEYNDFREQFGLDKTIVVAITPEEIFNLDFLEKLKTLHKELENKVPNLKEVNSLINARNTFGDEDALIVEDLLEKWPENEEDLKALKKKVMSNPVYLNNFISEDGKVATLVLEAEVTVEKKSEKEIMAGFDDPPKDKVESSDGRRFLTPHEKVEVVLAVDEIIKDYDSPSFPIALAGMPVQSNFLRITLMKDTKVHMRILALIIAICLFLFFRKISGVILPLGIVMLSVLSTISLMAVFKVYFSTPSQIIPTFLMAVGVGDAVHVLAIFYKKYRVGTSKEDAIAYALGHSGVPILVTSLTTAAGLLSFSFAKIAPIAHMGIFSATGVMLAFIYTIIFIPPMLSLIPVRPAAIDKKKAFLSMDRVLIGFGRLASTHPKKIISVSLIILAVSLPYLFRVGFSHDPISWFPETNKVRKDVNYIDDKLGGATSLEIIIDTEKKNGLYEPAVLNGIENISRKIEATTIEGLQVGKVFSMNDLLKETNQALHANDSAFYTIPKDRKTIAQELFLFENSGSDDLESLVDKQFSKARFTIKTPWVDTVRYAEFIESIKKEFKEQFQGNRVTTTGMVALVSSMIPATITSAIKSYGVALIIISLMMFLLMGKFKLGLISLVPNFLPIILITGIMGFFNIPFDMMTIFIGSIAIGLIVDDTVHFFYNFRRYYTETADPQKAIEKTLLSSGRALFITSLILCAGFFVFTTATMINHQRFGYLTLSTIIIALLADFLLASSLLVLVYRKKKTETLI